MEGNPDQKVRGWNYDMVGQAAQCVERYCKLANMDIHSLKPVTTHCMDDHNFSNEESKTKGELASVAARIVLKVLYTARIGRPESLWTVNIIARCVTKWTLACDKYDIV